MSDLEAGQSDIETLIAVRKNQVVAQLTDAIVHDFRNLFLVMEANLDLVSRGGNVPEEAKTYFSTMSQAVQQGKQLAGGLLPLSRQADTEPEVLSLNSVVVEASFLARKLLPASIVIDSTLADIPMWVRSRRGTLLQAILGLVLVAKDEMSGGVLAFKNSQAGTESRHALSLIAQPAIAAPTRDLAVVLALARSMGGHFTCANTAESTAFTFTLPAHSPPHAAQARSAMGAAVVVESDPMVRAVIYSMLQQLGFDVNSVNSLDALSGDTLTNASLLFLQHPKDHIALRKILISAAAHPETQFAIAVDPGDSLPTHSANVVIIRKPFRIEDLATAVTAR